MEVLFLCGEGPTAAQHRPRGLLAALARGGHTVTLIFADRGGATFDDLAHCCRMIPVRPRQLGEAVAAALQERHYDLLHVDRGAAPLLAAPPALPTVLDAAICAGMRQERALRALGPLARAAQSARLPGIHREEAALIASYTSLIAATEDDAVALRRAAEGQRQVHVVPSPLDLQQLAPPVGLRDPATLLLDLRDTGRIEATAAMATMATAMALIWAERADARLTVIGQTPLGAQRLAGDPRVVVAGTAQDAHDHLTSATLAVAPVEAADSAPHAALEALATGTPLVGRRAHARDLGATAEEELLVAEGAEALARAALALLNDPPFRGRLGRAGRRLVEEHHSWERTLTALEDVYGAATGSAIAAWRLEVGVRGARSRAAQE
jgi:glycosyltransferase involved in cell wall biosynthesis